MKLSELKLNKNNPRKISDTKLNKLKESIKAFPKMLELRPLIIDKKNMILGGNMRYKALCELGYTEIPNEWVKIADKLTAKERKQFVIEDNVSFGSWNEDILYQNYTKDELLICGFSEDEIIITSDKTVNADVTNDEKDVAEIAKKGDIWELQKDIILHCEDSIGQQKDADLLIYDPPFELKNVYEEMPQCNDNILILFWDCLRCSEANYHAVKKNWKNGIEFIIDGVTSWYVPGRPLERHKGCGVFGVGKWDFDNAIYYDGKIRDEGMVKNTRGKYKYKPLAEGKHLSTLEQWSNAGNVKDYKYEKPLHWMRALINGCGPVKTIYDPFAGSCTSAIIAAENNVKWTGCEVDPKVVDIALSKWVATTGTSPVRQDGKKYVDLYLDV